MSSTLSTIQFPKSPQLVAESVLGYVRSTLNSFLEETPSEQHFSGLVIEFTPREGKLSVHLRAAAEGPGGESLSPEELADDCDGWTHRGFDEAVASDADRALIKWTIAWAHAVSDALGMGDRDGFFELTEVGIQMVERALIQLEQEGGLRSERFVQPVLCYVRTSRDPSAEFSRDRYTRTATGKSTVGWMSGKGWKD